MKDKIRVLIFGASGTIGKNLVRKLTEADYIVTCQTRNRHKSISLMTQGAPGYIIIEECQIFDEKKNLVASGRSIFELYDRKK